VKTPGRVGLTDTRTASLLRVGAQWRLRPATSLSYSFLGLEELGKKGEVPNESLTFALQAVNAGKEPLVIPAVGNRRTDALRPS
jgi:hypothetical protein